MRRKAAIRAVLQEQQVQQSRLQRTIMYQQEEQYEQQEPQQKRRRMEAYYSYCDSHNNNMIQIRKVYENHTTFNTLNAVEMGRYDSEEALSVYVEDQHK